MKAVKNISQLLIGTYAEAHQDSIFIAEVDQSGTTRITGSLKGGKKTSYMALNEQESSFYVLNEVEDFYKGGGAVASFHQQGKAWKFGNRVASGGALPVAICFAEKENCVVVANYTSGTIAVLPVTENGHLGEVSNIMQHTGSGPHSERQTSPHAHQALICPEKRFVFVVDLGTDEITGYTLHSGKLKPVSSQAAFKANPGSGPRHLIFHPDGKHAFLVLELHSAVAFLRYIAKSGTFEEIKTVSAIPANFREENKCGAIYILENGRTLYITNRGHDSIASFSVDVDNESIKADGHTYVQGRWPRDFCINKAENLLVAACRKSNSLSVFQIDTETGELHFTGHKIQVDQPVFCTFYGEGK